MKRTVEAVRGTEAVDTVKGGHHWTHFTPVWKELLVIMSISDGPFGHRHAGPCFAVALSHNYRWELTVLYVLGGDVVPGELLICNMIKNRFCAMFI